MRLNNLLYRIRAWIDNRVPRDVLVIEIRDGTGKPMLRITHLDMLMSVKMGTGFASVTGLPAGAGVHFTTEHLEQ